MRIEVVDPLTVHVLAHDGPRCDHRIVVKGFPVKGNVAQVHSVISWGTSVLLSAPTSREFADALNAACDIADQMARNGGFDE